MGIASRVFKANHPPERVHLLAEAGFVEFQPGIESFSTQVLKRMDKGVRAVDNASLLKAAYINGLVVDYNMLYGLPGDQAAEYESMLASIPRIYHLSPPVARTQTVITRFAPLQANPERFGVARQSHHHCYDVLFSEQFLADTGFDYDRFAYYFERGFEYPRPLAVLYSQLVLQIEHWKSLHRQRFVRLSYSTAQDGHLRITDSRFDRTEQYILHSPSAEVYAALDARPVTRRAARKIVSQLSEREFFDALTELDERRLVWLDGESLLGLAVPDSVAERHEASGWPKLWNAIYV